MSALLQVSALSKAYQQHPVLHDINLQIQAGEIFSLVGINGAGKTTLLKCILDFHQPDGGDIEITGTPFHQASSRQYLGYLPERFVPPYYLNGEQFVRYMHELNGLAYDNDAVLSMLASLDLPADVLKQSVRHYSKGMAQKLGIATLLLLRKKIYIFDEPMSGLDPKARACVKAQIREQKKQGNTIFFSSHLLADVEELSDRLAILHQGEIAFCGSPEECKKQFDSGTLEQAFLNCISE